MASQPIYQFYSELGGYEPKVWRRFQVLNNITMSQLGYILMTMYEMEAKHLFCIEVPIRKNYGLCMRKRRGCDIAVEFPYETWKFEVNDGEDYFSENSSEFEVQSFDASERKLKYVLNDTPGEKLLLEYDYGDGWSVEVTLEGVLEDIDIPGRELPRVLEGEGHGIIEDCGGVEGLRSIAEAFGRKCGPEYEQYCQWLGTTEMDLNAFNIEDINFRLKKVPRIYRELYELGYAPSKRSIALLERKYMDKK